MSKRILLFLLCSLPVMSGCLADKDYDLDELNTEVTLFEESISLPLGNMGPITLESIMPENLSEFIYNGEDGFLCVDYESEICSISAHEIASKTEDGGKLAYKWEGGTMTARNGLVHLLLSLFGMRFPDQTVTVSAVNPLRTDVSFSGTIKAECEDNALKTSGTYMWPCEDHLNLSTVPLVVGEYKLPDDQLYGISHVSIEDLTLDLPEGWIDSYVENTPSHFIFSYEYHSHVSFGWEFSMDQDFNLKNLHAALGQYHFKKCALSLTLENTLPLELTIEKVEFLKPRESDKDPLEVDPNIVISKNIHVAGGSLRAPGVTPITLEIEALEGTIPDINGIHLVLHFGNAEGARMEPLSLEQGLYVKSAFATIDGGITLNLQ